MLLNEVFKPTSTSLTVVNRYLKECYGYRINPGASTSTLSRLYTKISDDLYNLKLTGMTPQDSEYARKLMVREGISTLLKQKKILEGRSGPGSDVFNRVCAKLGEYACESINSGDSIDEAVAQAMRVYRSSRYRFPDCDVEDEIRECINQTFECGDELHARRDKLLDWQDEETGITAREIYHSVKHHLKTAYPDVISRVDPRDLTRAIEGVTLKYDGITKLDRSVMLGILDELFGKLGVHDVMEDEDNGGISAESVAQAIRHRLMISNPEVIGNTDPERLENAIQDEAEFRAGSTEMGSSDVSIMVLSVLNQLGITETSAGAIAG